MAVLNSWQKITRVIGKPFGRGKDGAATVASDPNTRATVTGSASSPNITLGTAILSNGDLFLMHQTQGSGVGQMEVNQVLSGGGTTSIVCKKALQYTYATGAQVIKFPEYTRAIITAHSITAWDGSKGGVEVICANISITVNGAITGTALGFRGAGSSVYNGVNNCGEGTAGASARQSTANGNGGGAGTDGVGDDASAGGGAGHAAAGTNGGGGEVPRTVGSGGNAVGTTDLITLDMGGGGGAGGALNTLPGWVTGGTGGTGGAIVILITDNLILNAGIPLNGSAGGVGVHALDSTDSYSGGGGGGAGGAALVMCRVATLGTNNITASAGGGGASGGASGGAGAVGRIAIHHSSTVTGTTTPTFTDVTDPTLYALNTNALFAALI